MRILSLLASFFALAGCLAGRVSPKLPAGTPAAEEEGSRLEQVFGVDPRARERSLEKRFPGVRDLSLVQVVIAAHDRVGPCWTAAAKPSEVEIEASWALEGEPEGHRAVGLAELAELGWTAVYRTPQGTGVELRAPLRSIDMTMKSDFTCVCSRPGGVDEGERRSVDFRVRWEQGRMPELSAHEVAGTTRRGLRPRITSGRLFRSEYAVRSGFPDGNLGRCGLRLDVDLLVDPPIL